MQLNVEKYVQLCSKKKNCKMCFNLLLCKHLEQQIFRYWVAIKIEKWINVFVYDVLSAGATPQILFFGGRGQN